MNNEFQYIDFLKNKMAISHNTGVDINESLITPSLYPHVKETGKWQHLSRSNRSRKQYQLTLIRLWHILFYQ